MRTSVILFMPNGATRTASILLDGFCAPVFRWRPAEGENMKHITRIGIATVLGLGGVAGVASPAFAESDVSCAYVSHYEKSLGGQYTAVGNQRCTQTITVKVIVNNGPDSGCLSVAYGDAKHWETSIGDYDGIVDC